MQTATVTAVTATMGRVMRGGMIGLVAALLLAALALVPPAATVRAAGTTYIVTTTLDNASNANCTVASCTLRQAVNASNANDPGAGNTNTITFNATFNSAQTITLANANGFRALTISKNVTIDATVGGRTVTIDGNNAVQLFAVDSYMMLGLSGLTLTRGNSGSDGGAIENNYGGILNITGSTFSGNSANGSGGAVNNLGAMNITGSTFTGNSVHGGRNGYGGAINHNGTTLTAVNSTFTGNTANSGGFGGAIANNGTLISVASTFTGNHATDGGGIGLSNCCVSLTLSIVAGNTVDNAGADIYGGVTSGGGNVVGSTGGGFGASDKTGIAASAIFATGALTSNGGPVQTVALAAASPARDTLACPTDPIANATLATDARGIARPQGAACDAGAYEAQVFVVTRAADDVNDANCATVANGGCTLRQAVNASNANNPGAGTNTITFAPTTFGTAQTITLTAASGPLTLSHPVTITGPGANLLTVDAGCTTCAPGQTPTGGTKHFLIPGAGNYAISGMTLQHGNGSNAGSGSGGAVDVDTGSTLTLTLTNMVFRENASGNNGGAVSASGGGAITLRVAGSTFIGNTGANGGGAISIRDGTAQVTNSTLSGNSAGGGGAIVTFPGTTLTLTGSTVSGNTSNGGGSLRITDTLNLTLSVVAGNTGGGNFDIDGVVTTDGGGNVVGDTTGSSGLTALSDRLGTAAAPLNPLLGTLGTYGATNGVQTLPLLPGSPAIDIAACPTDPITNATLATDARGVSRPQGTNCDAGAFESRGVTGGTLTGDGQSATITTQFTSAVGFTVSSANGEPVTGGQVTFTIIPGAGGASATFGAAPMGCTLSAMNTVAVCTISAGGVTTGPTFTANGTPGGFTIVATASGVPTTTFTETNTGIAPTAVNDAATTAANTALTVPAATGVLTNDTKGTPAATITASTQPAHGSVMLNTSDGSFVYTPTAGYTGTDSFTYTISNGPGTFGTGSSTATVALTVNGAAPATVNDGPYTVTTGLVLTVNAAQGVLANDTRGNPTATLATATQPMHGSVTLNMADGSFVYTPTAGYTGSDSFTYTLSNGPGTFGTGSSTGTVTVNVIAATVTGLTTTAPTGSGSGNTGSATTPTLNLGGRLTLTTTATFNNNTSGTASPLMYTSSNPAVATVDASGNIVALTAGTTTITITGPNGSRTTITITVTGAAGTGLMPNPQPMAHGAAATAVATPNAQPGRHP